MRLHPPVPPATQRPPATARAVLLWLAAVATLWLSGCPIVVTCEDIPCEFGSTCNPNTGQCDPIVRDCRVAGFECRSGETCDPETGECRVELKRCTEQFLCPSGQTCNASSGICEPTFRCDSNEDCGPARECNTVTQACVARACDPARDDCPTSFVCGVDGVCVPGCREGGCPTREFCSLISGEDIGRCVPNCREDADCPFGQTCNLTEDQSRCLPEPPCEVDADCRSDEVCAATRCAQPPCARDGDCLPQQICQISTGSCVEASCDEDVYGRQVPNNALATAAEIMPGDYSQLVICTARSDWFAVESRSTDIVRVRVRQTEPEPDLDIYVYDEDGVPLVASQELGLTSSVKFATGRDQTVYIEIRPTTLGTVPYGMDVSREFCRQDAFEENDSRQTATVVPSTPGIPSELSLRACGFDEDWFRLRLTDESAGLRLTRTGGTPDLRVDLFTPDGAILGVSRDTGLDLLRVGAVGEYFVRASGALGQSGDYRLAFETRGPWPCADAGNHETPETSRQLAENIPATQHLCPIDANWEIEWWAIPVDRDGLLRVELRPEGLPARLSVDLISDDGGGQALVRGAVRTESAWVLEAFVEAKAAHWLRVSSSERVGRLNVEPAYQLSYSLTP